MASRNHAFALLCLVLHLCLLRELTAHRPAPCYRFRITACSSVPPDPPSPTRS